MMTDNMMKFLCKPSENSFLLFKSRFRLNNFECFKLNNKLIYLLIEPAF